MPDDAAPIEYDDLVKKARLGGVTKVEFLSANGDVAVATLSDGSLRSIKVEDDKSGSYKLAAKMRDYGVPYAYSFNLGKFNEAAKRTSMRSKNQNVLDAEARQRDEDARLAALDARLAAEIRRRLLLRSPRRHRPSNARRVRPWRLASVFDSKRVTLVPVPLAFLTDWQVFYPAGCSSGPKNRLIRGRPARAVYSHIDHQIC